MIDEKKLIETFEDMALSWGEMHDKESKYRRFDMEEIERVVDNQPKIVGWIPCSERLPEEKINPITSDFYEYQVTYQSEDVIDVRHYKFGRGHWWNGPGIMDENVTAWREPLEAYHG